MFNYVKREASDLEFVDVASTEDLANGERLFIEVGDKQIVAFNLAGKYFALADICSHDDGPVGDGVIEGSNIVCPRHGGEFDIQTGQARQLPAVVDIPAYPVRIQNGRILIGIPKTD